MFRSHQNLDVPLENDLGNFLYIYLYKIFLPSYYYHYYASVRIIVSQFLLIVNKDKNKSQKGPGANNPLSKIEEHEEDASNEKNQNEDLGSVKTVQNGSKDEKRNKCIDCDATSEDFDPLKFAIEFFVNYNLNVGYNCVQQVSSQG